MILLRLTWLRLQRLSRSGEALERAHRINVILLDKTGTLTKGEPMVTDIVATPPFTDTEVLQLAASAEHGSEHPLAKAIITAAGERDLELLPISEFKAIPGHGVETTVDGKKLLVGNLKLIEDKGLSLGGLEPKADRLWGEGKTVMFLGVDSKVAGIITLADTIKPKEAV